MYSDAQKCSDFAQKFQDVKLHVFLCPDETHSAVRLKDRAGQFLATFAQVLRPVRLAGAMLQDGTQFFALLVSLSMELMQATAETLGVPGGTDQVVVCRLPPKVYTVYEDLHEQTGDSANTFAETPLASDPASWNISEVDGIC